MVLKNVELEIEKRFQFVWNEKQKMLRLGLFQELLSKQRKLKEHY